MKLRGVLLAVPLLTASCGDRSLVNDVQKEVSSGFLDPMSAQFTETQVVTGEPWVYVCGRVNAKNGYGAYTGFKDYVGIRISDNLIDAEIIEDGSETPCEAYRRSGKSEDADRVYDEWSNRRLEKNMRALECATAGRCVDEDGLDNIL